MRLQGFVGPTYQMDARSFDHQRCVNLYPIISESRTSKSVAALRGTAGLELAVEAGGGPMRGCIETNGRSFWVSGNTLYEMLTNETVVSRGTLDTSTPRCTLSFNGTQIFIVDGTFGYIFNIDTDTFTKITDADFPSPAAFGTYQDNYFIVVKGGTSQFYISAIGDGTSWDALDFSSVESMPDDLVGAVSDGTNLFMLGRTSVEIFQNTGNPAFPFERISGALIPSGCAAPHTAIIFDNALTWMGQDDKGGAIVWRMSGYSAGKISTQAIERFIATSTNPVESYAYTYYEQGHAFYCLQVKGLSSTLVCDASTGYLWHEKSYKNNLVQEDQQHRASCHMYFNNKNYVGDRETGKIYRQSLGYYSDAGDEIIRLRISPHVADEKRLLPVNSFELDMEVGQGLTTGQGSDPQVMMSYSDDGGYTWSNERWKSAGKKGQYKTLVKWNRCGSSRDRVWKIAYSEPTFCQINEAFINNR